MTDVLHGIMNQARCRPDVIAVKDLDRELCYSELCYEASQLGTGLLAQGVQSGDRVALLLPNSVDFVVAALASLWIGAIFVPLAVTDPEVRLAAIVADCAPAAVLTSSDHHGEPSRFLGRSPVLPISALLRDGPHLAAPIAAGALAGAYAIYTSGTTGSPKGVLIGNAAFGAAIEATSAALGLHRSTRTLCVSPFYFDGSFGTLFPTLFCGGTVVIRPGEALMFVRPFFNAVADEGITYTGFTPSYLRLLLASPHIAKLSDTPLDIIALGGEASSIADIRALWSAVPKVRVFNRYGPTETTIAVTHVQLTPEVIVNETVPMGYPHRGVSFYLVDDDGTVIVEPDKIGELYIGGSQLMTGYWGAPALTNEVLRTDIVPKETVYRTGDLAYRDGQGRYVYVARADRVIKRSGIRISLVELSEVLGSLAEVSAATCLTFDDEGELGIVGFVVVKHPVSVLELQHAARAQLPATMLPNRIEIIEEFSLTRAGKLDERLLLSEAGLAPMRRPGAPGTTPPST